MQKSSPRFLDLRLLHTTKYHVLLSATDATTQMRVVIKTPRIEFLNDETTVTHLMREGEILAHLRGIPCVQQYVTHGIEYDAEKSIVYLAAQHAPGKSLYDTVRDDAHHGRFTHRDGIALMKKIAQALFPVHELGVIHCDLKLGNILWDSGLASCTIMDWAAAMRLDTPERTNNDPIIGTAQFMSYEHAIGEKLDCRTDIYALGIIVTLLVYGQELTLRYTSSNGRSVQRTKEETLEAIVRKETIKKELFELPQSSYDWGLRTLLERMTHWDRELRPRSMAEVAQECENLLNISPQSNYL